MGLDILTGRWRRWSGDFDDKETGGFWRYAKTTEGFSYLF